MEQEICSTMEGLFTIFNMFKLQYYKMIKSLHFCKSVRQPNENAEKWVGRLRIATVECNYTQVYRQMKEQFIYWLNGDDMLVEIIRKPTKTKESKDVMSDQVLAWAK